MEAKFNDIVDENRSADEILEKVEKMYGIAEKRRTGATTVVNQYGKKSYTKPTYTRLNALKVFDTSKDFLVTFEKYIYEIQESGYEELPTLTNFAKYVKCSPSTMQNYMYALDEQERKLYKAVLADMLYQGVNEGAYDRNMTTFAMKNLCDWSDRVETNSKIERKDNIVSKEEADKLIKEYISSLPTEEDVL